MVSKDFFLGEDVYLDSACVSLRPKIVFDAECRYQQELFSCASRSAHKKANQVTREVAAARKYLHTFFSASRKQSLLFTKNATESLNVVAQCLLLKQADVIITSFKEHNSNHLPWLREAKRSGCKHFLLSAQPDIDLGELEELLHSHKGKRIILSLVHVSNVDGSVLDVKRVSKLAKKYGAFFVLDACQSASHMPVTASLADVVVASGHKMLGPSVGLLIAPTKWLEQTDPLLLGGSTVVSSSKDDYTYADLPEKFEAGLQNYSGIIGLQEAAKYLSNYGLKNVAKHCQKLHDQVRDAFVHDKRILFHGQGAVCSFEVPGVDAQEVALLLNEHGILLRAGQHCAHTYFSHINKEGFVRASFHLYTSDEDINAFITALKDVLEVVC